MLDQKLDRIYKDFLKKSPGSYKIPEPPRGDTVRLYSARSDNPFLLIGDTSNLHWKSFATKRLDLTKNYWEKTPISNDILWIYNTRFYLVPPQYDKYFHYWKGAVRAGVSVFAEDEYLVGDSIRAGTIQQAQELGLMQSEELKKQYEELVLKGLAGLEPMPVRLTKRGRPKGSKNKPKELTNEGK